MLGNNRTLINAFYYSSLGVLALFTLGIATRLTAPLTWVVVCSFLSNPATLYEGDFLLVILAFYLMVGYAAGLLERPAHLGRFAIRLV